MLLQTGIVKSNLGNDFEAEQLARQSLVIREKQLGREHLDTAFSLSTLAAILYSQEKLIQAKTHAQRALSITERDSRTKTPSSCFLPLQSRSDL